MAKNAYAQALLKATKESYNKGVWDGMNFMLNLCAISGNRKLGLGDKRLTVLEQGVQELVDEFVDEDDPLVNEVHIERTVRQIRKKGWVEDG